VTSESGVASVAGKSIKKPFSRMKGNFGNTCHTCHSHHDQLLFQSSGGRNKRMKYLSPDSSVASDGDEQAVSVFQSLFFEQLDALTGRRRSGLFEQARKAGIPREAAEAFWRTRRKSARNREAA
jgi:hypothetical protein